jgi:L-amino acid N-acyltransferase YncA
VVSTGSTDERVRAATADDWPRIWPFFDAIVRAGETYAYPDDLPSERARDLWMERPPALTVVLEEGGRIVGSAKMGPNRPARGDHIGTASFMVDPDASGRGVGRALASYVVEWHREQGYAGIQFNAVVETNLAAIHMWRSLGFEIIGTVPGAFRSRSHGRVGLHVMYLPL